MEVVLDKSYLQGASAGDVSNLCISENVLMSESLFYELLTTEPEVRANCFKKIPQIDNPLTLVPNVGTILRFEIQNKSPCLNIKEVSTNIRYQFNKRLVSPDFKFTPQQEKSISEWKKVIRSRIDDFKKKSAVVIGWFPRIKGFKAGSDPEPIEQAKSLICKDHNVVKKTYEQIKYHTFPNTEIINERWALFRWIQVHILAALEYVRKYGDGNSEAISKKIENEFLDLDYCITALLVGALASRDISMIERFKHINPKGIVIS